MKEEKGIKFNTIEIMKKALEKAGFKIEIFSKKFNPDKNADKLLTIGFLRKVYRNKKLKDAEMEDEAICSIDTDSINIFHDKKIMVSIYSHVPIKDNEQFPKKFDGISGTLKSGLIIKREKDGLRFNIDAVQDVKDKGFEGWRNYWFICEYYIERQIKKIIKEELEVMKEDFKKVQKKQEVKDGRVTTNT
jgi:hypothetical protein